MPEKKNKPGGTEAVNDFIAQLQHPLKPVLERLRQLIQESHPELTEHIKWNAPSFCYHGDDRITFNIHKQDAVLIIFHRGAKTKDRIDAPTLIRDNSGLLKWQSADRAVASFRNMEDVDQNYSWLQHVVEEWIKATDGA